MWASARNGTGVRTMNYRAPVQEFVSSMVGVRGGNGTAGNNFWGNEHNDQVISNILDRIGVEDVEEVLACERQAVLCREMEVSFSEPQARAILAGLVPANMDDARAADDWEGGAAVVNMPTTPELFDAFEVAMSRLVQTVGLNA